MEEMLRVLVKELVNDPSAIEINSRKEGNVTTLELKVAQEDMGKVIGKQGKIAKSIRTLMKAYGAKVGEKINVDILD
ncbi:MAG: KH domain-containing protein [Clostridia bacterium]|nr:KH domain-containing protein [Clostridia bacterium]